MFLLKKGRENKKLEFCLNPVTSSHQIHNGDGFCCFTGVTTTILEKRCDDAPLDPREGGREQIFVHLEPPAAKPPSPRKRHTPTLTLQSDVHNVDNSEG